MKKLTLKQKNEMIDWMIQRCGDVDYPRFNLSSGVWDFFKGDISHNSYNKIFGSLFPEMRHEAFDNQIERITYLLLVKEFINH